MQLTGFAMPLQDALTGAGILNLPRGPFPLPVPLVTVVGPPLRLPPFSGEARKLTRPRWSGQGTGGGWGAALCC